MSEHKLTKSDWRMIDIALFQLWNGLDMANTSIMDEKLYKQNENDKKKIEKIRIKIVENYS